jgi:hypothetical protein
MVERELFVQFLLKEIKYNPNWHLNALNKAQLKAEYTRKLFTKTPKNHELAVKLFLKNPDTDVSKFYKPNYVYKEFILGTEFHVWANKPLDILQTKRVGVNLYIATQCIPSEIILLPLIQLARRQHKRISPDMLVQHLIGEIDLLNQFINP